MTTWHEDDGFWTAFEPILFDAQRMADAPRDTEAVINLVELPFGAAVLDVPCGPGRHALEFARRGFPTTAVDRVNRYLERGVRAALEAGLEVEWVEGDMRAFRREASFDLIVNLFTSFGYFADPADDARVLANWHASLRGGGALVIELASKEIVARNFMPQEVFRLPDESLFIEERRVGPGWDWMVNEWTVIRGSECHEFTVEHRLYSAVELSQRLREAGFSRVESFGAWTGEPFDHDAERLILVARK